MAIDPKYKFALYNKGWDLGVLGNYKEAITYFDKALAIDPKYENALNGKGLALDGLGNHTGAITYLDKALAIDPKDEDALYHKGVVLDKLGNHTGAILYYDKARAIKSTTGGSTNMTASNMTSSTSTSPTLLAIVKSLVDDAVQAIQNNDTGKALGRMNLATKQLSTAGNSTSIQEIKHSEQNH